MQFSHESTSYRDIDSCENSSKLTCMLACQQHRLEAMHYQKAKSFPAPTVSAVGKLVHRRRGKRGARSDRRVEMLGVHTRVSKIVDNGEVEAESRTQHVERTKARI